MRSLPRYLRPIITKLVFGVAASLALVMSAVGPDVVTEAQQQQPLQQPSPFTIQEEEQQQQPLQQPMFPGSNQTGRQQQQQPQTSPQSPTQINQGMIADLAKPAVVQVGSRYIASVSAYTWDFNNNLLVQDLQSLVDQGVLDPDDPEAVDYARTLVFLENPAAYIMPTEEFWQTEVETTMTGSGFIVTPDGYIITNAHVVSPSVEDIQYSIFEQAVYNFITSDMEGIGIQFETEEQINAVSEALYQFYYSPEATMTIDSASSNVFVLARYSIPGVVAQTGEEEIPAEVLPHATGEPIPGKDVAIVKIEGTNFPTLPIGDDRVLQTLDPLTIVGFPGAVSSNPVLSPTGQEPTVLTGQFNGYQRTMGGWDAMHVQAPIGHGNSGGPALDSSGRVVGIATFGSVDPNTGQETSGFNFLVPISIVKDFLNRANVQPTDSQFTTMYRQALTAYANGNYEESLSILQQLNGLSPNNPYVVNYLSRVQQAAGSSSSSSPPPSPFTSAPSAPSPPVNTLPNSP